MSDLTMGRSVSSGRLSVLRDVLGWLEQGEGVWLCTIVQTWGSSPRPEGSWLAVSSSGMWSGSVSGGCLEEDLLRRAAEGGLLTPELIDYGITESDQHQFQLPCGGRIRLLVEPLEGERSAGHVAALVDALEQRSPVCRRVSVAGEVELEQAPFGGRFHVHFDGAELQHLLQPECRLLFIGAGEVARYAAEFASAADFDVTLCEPREAFAAGWSHANIPLVRRLPDDLIAERFSDAWSGILALAHDPRVDDMGLLAALQSDAFYVGAMGSKKTSAARRERLASLGVDEASLQRLKAPIGVSIPSKTPAEIAISIVADLIAERHRLRQTSPAL
ncbi:XdhC family protein [Marinobacter sp. F4216]|uniref:XdhC family protein n=1 Tax=Marinobacter sp. F4216 TaxID=2874281 RepID=UPI001CC00736|nr:XdhC family protein [Marinobacter sp. F4216]